MVSDRNPRKLLRRILSEDVNERLRRDRWREVSRPAMEFCRLTLTRDLAVRPTAAKLKKLQVRLAL